MKKFLLIMVTLLCGVNCINAYDFEIDGIYYQKLSNSTVEVTFKMYNRATDSYTGKIQIPTSVLYEDVSYSVTSIGNSAFCNCSGLISITIPNSVTSIEFGAFNGCNALISITIPYGVSSIGDMAFNGCSSLTSITLPEGVTSIGQSTFRNMYLEPYKQP